MAVAIVVPAILYSRSEGSILQTLSQVGAYFVGAKLSMYGLGFFSKHATEKGVLVGVVVGFVVIWLVATQTEIAWPWYCLIGGVVNVVVSLAASLMIDGRQSEYSAYTIQGQKAEFAKRGQAEQEDGWYVLPGRVDPQAYGLIAFFAFTMLFLFGFQVLV